MATQLIEGFDNYGPIGILSVATYLAEGGWTIVRSGGASINAPLEVTLVLGLAGEQTALKLAPTTTGAPATLLIERSLPSSISRIIGGYWFEADFPAELGTAGIVFIDGSTSQCSIFIEPVSGFAYIAQGSNVTVLQLGTMISANQTFFLAFDITFGTGTAGNWTVWLDGEVILIGQGATQQSANSTCDLLQFVAYTPATGVDVRFTLDHLHIFDDTTDLNNSALIEGPQVITNVPNADVQTEFTNVGNVFGYTSTSDSANYSMPANTLYLTPFTPNVAATLNSIVTYPTSTNPSANFRSVLYADASGVAGTLLTSSAQVTGCTAGTALVLPLVDMLPVVKGVQYWLGLIGDTTISFASFNGGTASFSASNTYSGGPPGTAPTMTSGILSTLLYGACTGAVTNWESEDLNPPIGDISSVETSVAGKTDLYVMDNLPAETAEVYSVCVAGNCRTGSGAATVNLIISSQGVVDGGAMTGLSPTSSYAWLESLFDTDPGTGNGWLVDGANGAYYGMAKVT